VHYKKCDFLITSQKLLGYPKNLLYPSCENTFAVQFRMILHGKEEKKYEPQKESQAIG
jgi:hypothetical protein